MPRPVKWRKVEFIPKQYTFFAPCPMGRCGKSKEVEEIQLKVEELEAMRLKDIEGLSQEEAAEKMHISRQTFQNIIDTARKKIVTALVEGKALSIGGGHYTEAICNMTCPACGEEYEVPVEKKNEGCRSCGFEEVRCHKSKRCNRGCSKE